MESKVKWMELGKNHIEWISLGPERQNAVLSLTCNHVSYSLIACLIGLLQSMKLERSHDTDRGHIILQGIVGNVIGNYAWRGKF